jgi:hypothetical protein
MSLRLGYSSQLAASFFGFMQQFAQFFYRIVENGRWPYIQVIYI